MQIIEYLAQCQKRYDFPSDRLIKSITGNSALETQAKTKGIIHGRAAVTLKE